MKIALYADIHAHLAPLDAVLAEIDKENVDHEIVIGDIVMSGPEPAEVIERLQGRKKAIVLSGNYDSFLANRVDERDNPFPMRNEWSRLTRERLSKDQVEWLRGLWWSMTITPEKGHDFHIFHGTPDNDDAALPLRLTDEEVKERLAGATAEIMAFGQVHGPYIRQVGNQTLVCAAAAGYNWDGDTRPAYALVEYEGGGKWNAEIKRVEYDIEAQAKKCEESWIPNPERYAKMLRTARFWDPDRMPH